jgi:hypothetical protein
MADEPLQYDRMVEGALRSVVREALAEAAKRGLPGDHHFYVTFRTKAPGVVLPHYLTAEFPDEMTIVLQHQFWDLTVDDVDLAVTLSFRGKNERLRIPLMAITAFADPSVNFGLKFVAEAATTPAEKPAPATTAEPTATPEAANVVALDAFRKK